MSENPQVELPGVHDAQSGSSMLSGSQRRVRHITSIQVRNLTPFPVRDAFASALSQPSEQSQFTTHGHLSDDWDVTLSRRRSRRISVNSVNTLRSLKSDEGISEDMGHGTGTGESGSRRRTSSRVSFSGGGSLGPSSAAGPAGRTLSVSGSAPTIRPHRPRTTSIASTVNSPFAGASLPATILSGPLTSTVPISFSAVLPDNSQTGLEKVIKSRLVETFLSITIPPPVRHHEGSSNSSPQLIPIPLELSRSPPATPPQSAHLREKPPILPQKVKQINPVNPRKGPRPPANPTDKISSSRRDTSASQRISPAKSNFVQTKSPPVSTLRQNGKAAVSHSSSSQKFPIPSPPSMQTGPSSPSSPPLQSMPNYLSTIHRPSTNPSFPIDARSRHEFADCTDLSGEKLKVEVWGKVGSGWRGDRHTSAKGKEREIGQLNTEDNEDNIEWKVLEEWNIDLTDLVPLPDDLSSHTSQLPSNTLLISLSPPGQTFYLPSPHVPYTRSPTPSVGYTSDPESEVRKVKQAADSLPELAGHLETHPGDVVALSRRRHRRGAGATSESTRDAAKTAGWQDLFKLVTLQSCILDNEGSLSDIVRGIDKVLEDDVVHTLKREASERESWVEALKVDCERVREKSKKLKHEIEARRKRLRERRDMLTLAMGQHREELASEAELAEEVSEERGHLLSLRARFPPTRTTLLTTLSAIFPIELLSPPDLLYTILDIPLPIPLSSTDPAPPLTLSDHKSVTEDGVATSLGYVAQVVQLLAAYLGKGLVYPVTCIGSRSLIRDGISAMVGPRMFPLFSKGVDTYRFEYGVFLLNKDIEMLMVDRELRALDMRHTLPNLKNLLLTLTDGEGAHLSRPPRVPSSPQSSVSGLESPPRAESPVDLNSSTPKATQIVELPAENTTPPASGSTTPTTATADASKRMRPFLGLSPFAGFLRSRYPSPSGRPSVKADPETSEGSQENGNGDGPINTLQASGEQESEEDEEDRQTIRGLVVDGDADLGQEVKKIINGRDSDGGGQGQREKLGNDNVPIPAPTTPPPPVVHVR